MTIWYVDSAIGSDTNNGLTPATAFLTISKGHSVTNPGDTVYIMPGKGYGGGTGGGAPLVALSRSGSAAGGYITYSGYPGMPMPMVNIYTDGFQVFLLGSGFSFTTCVMPSYIVLQNLEIVGNMQTLTYQNAWNDATTQTFSQPYSTAAISCADQMATIVANSSTTTTLNLQSNPTTAGVAIGDVVIDATVPSRVPSGTTVVTVGTTSVTVSASVTVSTGDSINFVRAPHHIQIKNCKIHDFTGAGISLELTGDYITISGCLVYNCAWYTPNAGSGISLFQAVSVDTNTTGYNNNIVGNLIYNNRTMIPWARLTGNWVRLTTNGITATNSTTLHFASTTGVSVGWAVFDTTSAHAGFIAAGTYVTAITSTTITISTPPLTQIPSAEAMAFVAWSDGEGLIIDDLNGDQESKRPYAGKTLVSNNIAIKNGSCGLLSFDSPNVDVVFNTCYQNMDSVPYATQQAGGTGDMEMSSSGSGRSTGNCYNNIVYSQSSIHPIVDGTTDHVVSFGNNLTFGNATAPPGTNNQANVDPLFVSPTSSSSAITALVPSAGFSSFTNFQLQPGSPAIDNGSGSFTRTTDFLGNAGLFGPSYDMGACESPCSPWGGNPIQSMSTVINSLLATNGTGAINAVKLREAIVSLWAGRPPYPR